MASFKVLDTWRIEPDDLAYYRVLVGTDTIKYFVVDEPHPGPFRYRDTRYLTFDILPEGDWTIAHLAHDNEEKLVLRSVETRRLRDVTNSWHQFKIDLQSLGDPAPEFPYSDDMYDIGHPYAATFYGPPGAGVPRVLALWNPGTMTLCSA